jgi:hypothetical protein
LARSKPGRRRSVQKRAPLIEACQEGSRFDGVYRQHVAPDVDRAWSESVRCSLRDRNDAKEQLYLGLASARRSAAWAGAMAVVVPVVAVLLAVFVPLLPELLRSVMSEVPARLISSGSWVGLGVRASLLCIAWRESSLQRVREYEDRITFTSSIHEALSAAVTVRYGPSISRVIGAFEASQKSGVLSAGAASALTMPGRRRNGSVVARFARLFLK